MLLRCTVTPLLRLEQHRKYSRLLWERLAPIAAEGCAELVERLSVEDVFGTKPSSSSGERTKS